MNQNYKKEDIKRCISAKLINDLGVDPASASDDLYYKATAMVMKDILFEKRKKFSADANFKGKKQVYYLSMEFLLGRSLKNSIYNLELVEEFTEALRDFGVNIEKIYEYEPDAGLGNGGLGRLAACYLDAMATTGYRGTGYSILYEYGIFKQKIIDGWQSELPDYWLPGGDVWLTPCPENAVEVRFGGELEEHWDRDYHMVTHKNYSTVLAVPYEMHISGYNTEGVSKLKLWQAKSPGIDMDSFNRGDYVGAFGRNSYAEVISKVLYPNDNNAEGKKLRLRQQYFLAAASVADIVRRHMNLYGSLDNFSDKNAIHINDTHPTLAIPELMRILLDECGYPWEKAWGIVTKTFAYTNHTVMAEALEKWNEDMFKALLPRIYQIVIEINRRMCEELRSEYRLDENTIGRMAILQNHQLHMANLCVAASHSVNGVSKLHSEIIKEQVFRDFYTVQPFKFQNVTNGIASRRWLYQSNPGLTRLLKESIGDDFLNDLNSLDRFSKFAEDKQVLEQLAKVKQENKQRFADYIFRTTSQVIDPNSIFDVQVKRLHEYKRQHLNALHILHLYRWLKENPNAEFTPRTFIFGAKAAPGYYIAKQIIKFICTLAKTIDEDPAVRDKLKIVYLEDYRVTLSELLMPASEISEQISLAGTEASGTGNMKLMLNGAITLGTLDGANVEIGEAVGPENIIIFGMTTPEVNALRSSGYNPESYYQNDLEIRALLDALHDGVGGVRFDELIGAIRYSDPYMVLADFQAYKDAQKRAGELYRDFYTWQRMSLINIAKSGIFCADRAIQQYARNIWSLD